MSSEIDYKMTLQNIPYFKRSLPNLEGYSHPYAEQTIRQSNVSRKCFNNAIL